MTQAEWDKKARSLNRSISAKEKAAKKSETLALKVEAQREVKDLREQLRQHRLQYHSLVTA